jgi:hypothetical protein
LSAQAPPVSAAWADARADCCIANAAFRVLLPPTPGRPRAAELLLCGHHYRRSYATLRGLGAVVFSRENELTTSNPGHAGRSR